MFFSTFCCTVYDSIKSLCNLLHIVFCCAQMQVILNFEGRLIIIITIIFINCNWVVTWWQWLFYMYTKYWLLINLSWEGYMRSM